MIDRFILKEDSFYLLKEDGFKLILEQDFSSPSLSLSPSSSQSPSSSVSASNSPSISPSASASASVSPSISKSVSPSHSASSSPSASTSFSPSPSPSASVSPSVSPSASPSPGHPVRVYSRGYSVSLPANKNDLDTVYSTIEEGNVYYRDGRFVSITATESVVMHLFKKLNNNRRDKVNVEIDLKTTIAPTTSTVYLQVWNGLTNTWETIDSNSTKSANEVFSLAGSINDTAYYDFDNEVAVRVWQQG